MIFSKSARTFKNNVKRYVSQDTKLYETILLLNQDKSKIINYGK
jgi:hypothetical protein